MKIAGVKTGKDRGEIVELPHHKKLEEALKMAAAKLPENSEEFKGFGVWARNIKVSDFNFTAKGTPLKDKWQNNAYAGSGTVELHRRQLKTDRVMSPKKAEFEIKFEDKLDEWGMPDIEVTHLEVT